MSNTEDISEIEKPKVTALITTSVLACIFGIAILIIRAIFYRSWWSEYVARNLGLLFGMIGLITGYLAVKKMYGRKAYFTFGIIILFFFFQILLNFIISPYANSFLWGFIGWASIACLVFLLITPAKNSMNRWVYGIRTGSLRNDIFIYSGIAIGLFFCGIWFSETSGPIQTEVGMGCGLNLQKLGNAISIYQKDNHGKYPDPNLWCDLLLKSRQVEKDDFICPEVKFRWKRQFLPVPIPINRKSYYAMNPNCEPNSPPVTVLLFEIKGGWNKSGGHELLITQNHFGLCHILFNNGDIKRIYKSEDIAALQWK
ncbi:MAG: hypothetical protein JW787_14100 [Sedimentisphaerales bacterium]|nr:hypothetical protein [Sedimentisphaerales bacterium]